MATTGSQFVLYKSFVEAFKKGHPNISKCACHFNAQIEWNKIKHNDELIKAQIDKYLSNKSTIEQNENTIPTIVEEKSTNGRKRTLSSDDDDYEPYDPNLESEIVTPVEPTFSKRDSAEPTEFNDVSKPWVVRSLERARARAEARVAKIQARRLQSESRIKTPVQEGVIQQIKEISERIASLVQVKNMGLSTADSNQTLKKLLEQKKERTGELRILQSKQRSSARYRQRKRRAVETLCANDPEVAAELMRVYKPTLLQVKIDNICPDLLQTLEEISRVVGAVDTNPRLINIQPCSSLDELRAKIKERCFEIRRSSTFYRLIPSGMFSEDGKRHIHTGPVRLRKLNNMNLPNHEDAHFVSATLQHINDLAGTFGNECVFYLIQDRKASVRIGRPTTRGHSPLIMHLDYQISTTNSTPMPASVPYQLKPIVYASCFIDDTGLVTNAGPTYISIRSAKHDQFTFENEEIDFDRVVKLKEFEKTARNHVGAIKPIIIMNVDTLEPKDYMRFPKTLLSAINKFKKYNLDAFFVISQAPGKTSLNIVERRLAALSQDLTGLVLPYDYFGTHLNVSGVTIDAEVEKLNIKRTGEVLGEVWNMDMIDQYAVVAQYIDPPASVDEMIRLIDTRSVLDDIIDEICDEEEDIPLHLRIKYNRTLPDVDSLPDIKPKLTQNIDEYWCATHVFQTQYTIQIVRCTKPECCGPWRSNYIQVFPHRFLPPPVPFDRSFGGVRLAEIESSIATLNPISPYYGTLFQRIQFHGIVMDKTKNLLLPFDFFCPSIQTKLHSRICSICKQYIPTASRLRNHYRVHQQRYAANSIDFKFNKEEEELIDEPDPIDPNDLITFRLNPLYPGVSLFSDMMEWLRSDFEDDPVVETNSKSSASAANLMIRQERQLQEAAAAAMGVSSIADIRPTTITIDDGSTSTNEILPLSEIKIENDSDANTNTNTENENVVGAMKQLVVNDSFDVQNNSLLDQYDDLSDLINRI